MKRKTAGAVLIGGSLTMAALGGLVYTGRKYGIGPFRGMFRGFEDEVRAIEKKYDAESRQNEIVFYGASNFRLWKKMEEDLSPYVVQNHGFGGSTDEYLMQYADRILYPYHPKAVFFQTGSNDYVLIEGTEEEKIRICMERKKEMFTQFHEHLPEAQFVVMSGLLLPGRSQYTDLTKDINRRLKEYCEEHDYMHFVDASAMTYNGEEYRDDLFLRDGIHLNHTGQLKWADEYILPMLDKLSL